MYETYLQNEREFDEKFTQDKIGEKVEGYLLYPGVIYNNKQYLKICTPNDVKNEYRLSRIKEMKALKEELEGEKWGSPYINGDFTHKHEEAYHHNAGLQLSLDKIREFIKLLEKGV